MPASGTHTQMLHSCSTDTVSISSSFNPSASSISIHTFPVHLPAVHEPAALPISRNPSHYNEACSIAAGWHLLHTGVVIYIYIYISGVVNIQAGYGCQVHSIYVHTPVLKVLWPSGFGVMPNLLFCFCTLWSSGRRT